MPTDPNPYVLATGDAGASRLRLVQAVHGPDSEQLLRRAGLRPGLRVADLGCGTGLLTTWIAEQVGPSGFVEAVDLSAEQIALARREAERRGLANVRFSIAPATETGLPRGAFDLVFCRFLLMHVPEPLAVLREMRALLRPGGVLVSEDGDFTSPFSEPPSAAFDRSFELYRLLGERRGLHFRIGASLYRLCLQAGLRQPEVTLAQRGYAGGEAKRLPEWTLRECKSALIAAGLADSDEIEALTDELAELAGDESTLFGMVRVTQVWGTFPDAGGTDAAPS